MYPPAAAPHHSRCLHSPRPRRRAFALVIVLIILSLLAVVAVSFLSSMSNERTTANALANKMRAEQAAQSGVDSAIATLRECLRAFPDSATVWENSQSQSADGTANAGTSLYVRAMPGNDQNTPNSALDADNRPPHDPAAPTAADPRKTFVLPLVSGAVFQSAANKATAINGGNALSLTDDKSIDLNARRKQGDTQGVLGTPPDYTNAAAPKPVRVPWVEIRQQGYADESKAPVIARYAFWAEDESFRANINYANLGDSNGHLRADNTINLTKRSNPYPPSGLGAGDVDLLGILKALGGTNPEQDAKSLYDVRSYFPGSVFPESRAFAHATGLNFPRYADIYGNANLTPDQRDQKALARYVDQISYYTTTRSAALNLSRDGSQRLNLNSLMAKDLTSTVGSAPDTESAQDWIDKIVNTISFHAPAFGQRFYRLSTDVSASTLNALSVGGDQFNPDHAKIYLYKIAANIVDYVDKDSMPTLVDNTGKVRKPETPTIPFGDPGQSNTMWAVGKDAAPFLQEAAARYTQGPNVQPGRYSLVVDYYVELWNMTTRDVKGSDLGPNPFIRIGNPTKWLAGNKALAPNVGDPPIEDSYPSPADTRISPPGRDNYIDISTVTFPAGCATCVTTDVNYKEIITDLEAQSHTVVLPFSVGKRIYTGRLPPGRDVLNMLFDTGSAYGSASSSSDYDTDITIGNAYGYIDGLNGSLPISASGRISVPPVNASSPKYYGGYLRGNWTNTGSAPSEGMQASMPGDPRGINEPLVYTRSDSNVAAAERSRFNNYNTPDVTQTLGLPNYLSVHPNRLQNPWPDFPPFYANPNAYVPANSPENVMTAAKAPSIIANAPLYSIGQLGDVYDPARYIYSNSINVSRGGGRSFKIGQHDDRWDGDANSPSRAWASWRLADFFDTSDSILQYGKINLNGIARDNGAALKAALTGFKFQPKPVGSDPVKPSGDAMLDDSTSGQSASKLKVDALVDEIKARLTAPATSANGQANTGVNQTGVGPFWERGEISELPGFGRTPTSVNLTYPNSELTGLDMSSAIYDRGREELVRRLIDMTTTRGDVFTVYALGQSLIQSNPSNVQTRRVTGTHQLKVTFRLVPKLAKPDNTGSDDFHPGSDAQGNAADFKLAKLTDRFDKPDHYDIQILSVSNGGG